MKLTGNPTDEELDSCAQLLYSHGTQTLSHMYDCIRNSNYLIKAKFKYWGLFRFLASKNQLINGSPSLSSSSGEGSEVDVERSDVVKNAEKAKQEKKEGKKTVKKNIQSVAASMDRMQETMVLKSRARTALE